MQCACMLPGAPRRARPARHAFRFTSATSGPEEIASACRSVGLEFMTRVAGLVGPWNPSPTGGGGAPPSHETGDAAFPAFLAWANEYRSVAVEDESEWSHEYALPATAGESSDLRQRVRAACAHVLAELEATRSRGANFADACIRQGLLTPSYNVLFLTPRRNECGWLPVDLPDVPLAARVLSLFAVDYLWAPAPYREGMSPAMRAIRGAGPALRAGLPAVRPRPRRSSLLKGR
jgi:hypothetical protein